ncbi:hypothetical protein BT63DRAFT_458281 [Microthyrium microscopicum]|uniref:Uncharacterized protein n=1 Tax=Microthyrium microscopicum TaxID=703497 RepID=A0A6A6U3B9_9PEZI|nr:hypothetical protein BT63DRAFT_458281 [Microthyrium microscopicum]
MSLTNCGGSQAWKIECIMRKFSAKDYEERFQRSSTGELEVARRQLVSDIGYPTVYSKRPPPIPSPTLSSLGILEELFNQLGIRSFNVIRTDMTAILLALDFDSTLTVSDTLASIGALAFSKPEWDAIVAAYIADFRDHVAEAHVH